MEMRPLGLLEDEEAVDEPAAPLASIREERDLRLIGDELEGAAVTECIELGNGLWEKGQTFRFNDAVSKVLTLKYVGWDNTRNRVGGNSLHLWGHRV